MYVKGAQMIVPNAPVQQVRAQNAVVHTHYITVSAYQVVHPEQQV